MSEVAWGQVVKGLRDTHNELGVAIVSVYSGLNDTGSLEFLADDEDVGVFDGPTLTKKNVGKWTHEHKDHPMMKDDRAVLWSAYVEAEDKSVVGIGIWEEQ